MYYIFASFIVGAFIGTSALVSHPTHDRHVFTPNETSIVTSSSTGPIVDNQALAAQTDFTL